MKCEGECEVWCVKSEVCGACRVCGVCSVKCAAWSLECDM